MRAAVKASIERAADDRLERAAKAVTTSDFYSYLPTHNYIFRPTRELWPASSVNALCAPPVETDGSPALKGKARSRRDGTVDIDQVSMLPSEWLDKHRHVEQMTWAPGAPEVLADRLVADGGLVDHLGCSTFNLYREPSPPSGDPAKAGPWVDHIRRVYAEEFGHVVAWLAHRVQRPGEKVNHSLVLGSGQGTGKDTALEPVKHAVGPWNFAEVSPAVLMGRFNGYLKSVILRISEAHDLGDVDRYGLYERTKTLMAAPPDVLRCDEKHLREHAVLNVTGVILTTNHKSDGIYLPADDRRHFVAWSPLTRDDFAPDYFHKLWAWYAAGGIGHVCAFLADYDLSSFNPKAPPPKTAAWRDIVDANRSPEDAELADVLDRLGESAHAVTLLQISDVASESFRDWLLDRRNRRQIPHRLEAAGFVPVRNDTAVDGLWKLNGRRQVVYARTSLTPRDRLMAAAALTREYGK